MVRLRIVGFVLWCMAMPSFASVGMADKMITTNPLLDLSTMEVSPHELALTQVLLDICPPFLNAPQKQKFYEAYHKQLQLLIPEFDPVLVMQQMNQQKSYHMTLKGVRAWTLSFPKEENKELCIEFAETPPY